MSTCPVHEISSYDLAQQLWSHIDEEGKKLWNNMQELEQALRQGQKNGGVNLYNDKPWAGEDKKWGYITRFEAVRFLDSYHQKSTHTPRAKFFADSLSQVFFDGKTHRTDGNFPAKPIHVKKTSDGDTCKVKIVAPHCSEEETNIRLSGIDTPESFISAKFHNQLFAFLHEWKTKGLVRAEDIPTDAEIFAELSGNSASVETFVKRFEKFPPVTLLTRRMVFEGKVASAIMHGLLDNAEQQGQNLTLEESFVRGLRASDDPARCDLINSHDMHNRRIGIIHVGSPDYITSFINATLPHLGDNDPKLQKLRDTTLSEAEKAYLTAASPEIQKILDPKQYPSWQELFPSEKIAQMSAVWSQLATGDRATDINMAMVVTGVAFSYTKYRMQHSDLYTQVETAARAGNWGLWSSPLFAMLDPQGQKHLVDSECGDGSCGKFTPFTPPQDCLTQR